MTPYGLVIVLAVGLALLGRLTPSLEVSPTGGLARARGTRSRHATTVPFAISVGVVLVAMAALRWRRGTDYWVYENNYDTEYTLLPWSQMRVFEEPGIRAVAKVAQWIYDDPVTMFALASLITVGLTTWTIYRSTTNFPLAIYLYVVSTAWQGSFNGVRQYVACAILFAGHRLILERRFLPYLGVVFLASLFHVSAWVALALYWLPRRQMRPLQTVLLLVGALVLLNAYSLLGEVFNTVKESDISGGSYFEEQINPLRILVALAPVALYLLFTQREKLSEAGSFYANVMYLHALVLIAAFNSAYVARFSIYTGVYIAVALPALLNMENRKLRALLTLVVVVGYGGFWYLETSGHSDLNPYRSVFER